MREFAKGDRVVVNESARYAGYRGEAGVVVAVNEPDVGGQYTVLVLLDSDTESRRVGERLGKDDPWTCSFLSTSIDRA